MHLKLLGQIPSIPSPGLELLVYLCARGEALREELRSVVPLGAALQALYGTPWSEGVVAQGESFAWTGESDLASLRRALRGRRWPEAWGLYGALLPGFRSGLEAFQTWLEAERAWLRSAIHPLSLALPVEEVLGLSEAELRAPSDEERALMALLMRGQALLRQGRGREAVLALGQALGVQEFGGGEFSALSLALLAEAHRLWGKEPKARQTAEKALRRAADAYAQARAYRVWHLITGDMGALEQARRLAEGLGIADLLGLE
jgi:tetratricopeptide (TPR) repeat protein